MKDGKHQEPLSEILRFVAPGTPFREGLENVLRAETGGLIVVGYSPEVMAIVDGGFSINAEFSPAYLYELAKMDGAIILSDDGKRILYANTQLNPDPSIPTMETGTRHRTAERVAKQTGQLVVSISQRRHIITLYKGNLRYTLKDISVILSKANQAIQTLEKYKSVLDQSLTNLSALEFEDMVTLQEVAQVIQRIQMVLRIKQEILGYITELGSEGRLISMQLHELVHNIEEEAYLLMRDYVVDEKENAPKALLAEMNKRLGEDLLDLPTIFRWLGYPAGISPEEPVYPRGYRILHKIPRLPYAIVVNLVEYFRSFSQILTATIEELDEVEGIGEVRARMIKEGLKRIQEQVLIDRHI